MHGEFFSKRKFEKFLRTRAAPGSGVTFAEIEVMLCNIPSKTDLLLEEEEERREREGKIIVLKSQIYLDQYLAAGKNFGGNCLRIINPIVL